MRDTKLITTHPCSGISALREGQEAQVGPHLVVLQLVTWKVSSLRPQMKCQTCHKVWWATANPPTRCVAARANA